MHRFFVSPVVLGRSPVLLDGAQAHQIRRVLRVRPGERVTLLDNCGWAYEASLVSYGDSDARFDILRRWVAEGEPHTHITLYQAVLKGEKFGWVLQKGTEVGISRFVPMICERNVADERAVSGPRRERWERIIREAAEQSGRGRLPVLAPMESLVALEQDSSASSSAALPLILWEEERRTSLKQALASCNFAVRASIELLVGPEGGFVAHELETAERKGARRVSLGPRTLRAETAGVVAAAAILYEAGEM